MTLLCHAFFFHLISFQDYIACIINFVVILFSLVSVWVLCKDNVPDVQELILCFFLLDC